MECLYDRRALYPVSHVYIPFALQLLGGRAWLTLAVIVLWELLEYTVFQAADSYVVFPGEAETFCDVILLDLGNGVLGLLLAKWFLYNNYKRPRFVWSTAATIVATTLVLGLWLVFSVWGHDCKDWIVIDCAGWDVPILTLLLLVYALVVSDRWFLWVGALYLNATWIPVSVPLIVYCTTAVLFGFAWITQPATVVLPLPSVR